MPPPRFLLLLLALAVTPALAAQGSYQREIQAWVTQSALAPPPPHSVVFTGSSSIRRWETLARDFAHYDVVQRGFGGSQLSDLNPVVSEIVLPYDPAAVVVFEGTNDVAAGKSAATVFADWQQLVDRVHRGQNPTRAPIPILFIGITPTPARWALWPVASQVNALVQQSAAADPSLTYIDVPSAFLATGSPPAASLFVADGLHLSPAGYALWRDVIRPELERVSPPTKRPQRNAAMPRPGDRLLFDLGPSDATNGHPTVDPDPNGHWWNDWHPVAGGLEILAGQWIDDLVDVDGASTGIRMVITGGWSSNGILNGGLLAPSPTCLGPLAVGTATEDYFFSDDLDRPGGFMLSGLDPKLAYDLTFFGSRDSTETRVTGYAATGACGTTSSRLQTSGNGAGTTPGYHGNESHLSVLRSITPDRFGQVFVDVQRLAGSYAYANVFELAVRSPGSCLGGGCGHDPATAPVLTTPVPKLGGAWTLACTGFVPLAASGIYLSAGRPAPLPFGSCTAHVAVLDPQNLLLLARGAFDANGAWSPSITLPTAPALAGTDLTLQTFSITGASPFGFELSNGWRTTLQP